MVARPTFVHFGTINRDLLAIGMRKSSHWWSVLQPLAHDQIALKESSVNEKAKIIMRIITELPRSNSKDSEKLKVLVSLPPHFCLSLSLRPPFVVGL